MAYQIKQAVVDGIERISYYPDNPRYKTPLLFQHGAWHGAWCWQWWQELFAEWGWVSHAHSLPNHAGSAKKRPVILSTMGFYTEQLKAEVDRLETKPVIIGHSMGGMITQWYLKQHGELPAAVLLASIPLHEYPLRYFIKDPFAMTLAMLTLSGKPFVRNPEVTAHNFISEGALLSPEELHQRMDDESLLVTMQLNHLLWHPRPKPQTPILVMVAEKDTLFSVEEEKQLAKFYGADFHLAEGIAHNVMMERTYRENAQVIHDWLLKKGIL